MTDMPVMAFDPDRTTNAQLMVDCKTLGYLDNHMRILDATYGLGSFWKLWRPYHLFTNDRDESTGAMTNYDYTHSDGFPFSRQRFGAVVFDPPYKLNGTPTERVDARYGVQEPTSMSERLWGITRGVQNCARVADGFLLVKIQDQVSGGKVRWQGDVVKDALEPGLTFRDRFRLRDELFVSSYRPQPAGRSQKHARRNYSTLMVFERTT